MRWGYEEWRIGAIGHSSGGFWTIMTMAGDQRIKFGVASGFSPTPGWMKSMAPRPFMQLVGKLDFSPEMLAQAFRLHETVREEYAANGNQDDLVLRTPECDRVFLDEFKWEAYAKLRRYFGIEPEGVNLDLSDCLERAFEATAWAGDGGKPQRLPRLSVNGEAEVYASPRELENLFRALIISVGTRAPVDSVFQISIDKQERHPGVCFHVEGGRWQPGGCQDHLLREAEMLSYFHGISFART